MQKLQITIDQDAGRVVLSIPAESANEVYAITMTPSQARNAGFTLVEMADKIESPWEESK